MRVIAGTARSMPLMTPEGIDTRPTQDIIKETTATIVVSLLVGALIAVLDLIMKTGLGFIIR